MSTDIVSRLLVFTNSFIVDLAFSICQCTVAPVGSCQSQTTFVCFQDL